MDIETSAALDEAAPQAVPQLARILVLDPVDSGALARLSQEYDVQVRIQPSTELLPTLVGECEVIIVRSGVQLTRDVIEAAGNLRCIARAGSGVDNIDLEACRERGITVFNIPGASASAVAELAIGVAIVLSRNIKRADRQIENGVWNKSALSGPGLRGRTLGVVGFGQIGSRVATLGLAHGMKVNASVASPTPGRISAARLERIELVPIDQLIRESDVVCLALPLTSSTHRLIDGDRIASMQPGAILVNVSRGQIIDESAIAAALDSGQLGGVALDVHAAEAGRPMLAGRDNVVLTPHLGAATSTAQKLIGHILVAELEAYFEGTEPANRVV